MRRFFSKFNIVRQIAKHRAEQHTAAWRVLLYSAPILTLFAPHTTHAAGAAGTALKKLGGGALGFAGNALSSVWGASVEAGSTLLVWIFIIWQLSDILADLFSGIFLFLMNFLIGVSQYNSFLGSHIVTIGWTVTRDIANMFLVVALLVIAFATILNVNSYQASSLLKDFFFAAILVNFSKLICGVLIDASQVVMMTFVSGYSETAAGNFVKMFQVGEWLQLALATKDAQLEGAQAADFSTLTAQAAVEGAKLSGDLIGSIAANFFSTIGANVFTTIIAFIGILAVISLDIILVVRIVTLWFLIVASPIAFVAKVLPVTKSFSSKWWHAFNQQLIAGPIVAFIVWISLASIAVSDDAFNLTKESVQGSKLFAETEATAPAAIAATKISQWENLALYFVPIVIFMLGAKWAVGVAGGAAKSISGFANKQLTGAARSGLGFLRKQSVGKGAFSITTAAKKGFVGERAPVTSFLGKAGGLANEISGGKLTPVQKALSPVFGAAPRGRTAAGYKAMKNTASKFGFGELGEKRTKAAEAEELGQHFDKIAKQKFDSYMKTANDPARSPAEQAAARAEALAQKNTYDAKAVEARKKANEYQKEIFTAEGKTHPQVLLDHMKESIASGNISTLELDTAKSMINDYYEKKQKKEVTKKKAEMGSAWDAKTEKEIEGRIGAEQEAMKSDLDSLVSNYKATNIPGDLSRDAEEKAANQAYDRDIDHARPDTQLKEAALTFTANVQAAGGQQQPIDQAQEGFANAVADQLKGMQDKHGALSGVQDPRAKGIQDQAEKHLMNAAVTVPLQRQQQFVQQVAQDARLDEISRAAAAALNAKITTINADPNGELQEILSRQSARGGGATEQLIKPSDIRLKKSRRSSTFDTWEGDAGIKFAAALDAGFDQVISNLDRDSLVPPVQSIIGQKYAAIHAQNAQNAQATLREAFRQINESLTTKQDPGGLKRKARANFVTQAIEKQDANLGLAVRGLMQNIMNPPPPPNPPAAP